MTVRKASLGFTFLFLTGLVAAAVGFILVSAGGSDQNFLDGISNQELAENNISILPGESEYQPGFSAELAREVAATYYPNVDVRGLKLGRFNTKMAGGFDEMAWFINLDPGDPDLVPNPRGGIPTYALIVISASTGEFLFGMSEVKTPPGGFPPGVGPARFSPPASIGP